MSTTQVGRELRQPLTPNAVTSSQRTRRLRSWFKPAVWIRHRVVRLLAPAVVYVLIRSVGLLALVWMAGRNKTGITKALTAWDGQWFLAISEYGYGQVPSALVDAFGQRSAETPLAFFPGYPTVLGLATELPGVDVISAAFAINVIAGLICVYGLVQLGQLVGGSWRCGMLLVALFSASPMAIVLSMAYSEALFCAFAVWSLVCLIKRQWLFAALGCVAAGLVRPTAAALIVAIGVAAVIAIARRRDGWWPWIAMLLSPLGLVGYLAWVARQTGRWDGWFTLQRNGWASQFDGGAATWKFTLDVLASARSVLEVTTVWFVVIGIVLLLLSIRLRIPWPLITYAVGIMFMALGSNGLMNSKARLLLPAFTLLLPAAVILAKKKPGTIVVTVAVVVLFSSWFGAYSITAWPHAI